MSNSIEEALNVIAKAIYGKDVRQAFMDAIRICYSDATKKDNANMEVAAARGTFSDLLSRLNDSDNKIAVSANNVTVSDAVNHFDGTIDSAYVLKKIYGKTVQDPVDLSIKSVENVEILSTGKNKFDGELEQGSINPDTGAIIDSPNFVRTKNFIPVTANDNIVISLVSSKVMSMSAICYDSNKNRINNVDISLATKAFVIPAGVKYIKIRFYNSNGISISGISDVQIELGASVTDYEEYKSSVQNILLPTPLRSLPSGVKDVVDCKSKTRITKIGKKIYNGASNELFTVYSGGENSTTVCFYTSLTEKKIHSPLSNLHLICNRFKSVSDAWTAGRTTECISETTGYSTLYFRINISRLSGYASTLTNGEKIALFKAWLAANPVTVLYELATSLTESVDANPFIPSYKDGFFNVIGNVVPEINMEYATSLGGSVKAVADGIDYLLNKEKVIKHDFKNFECRNVLDISKYKDNRGFQGIFKIENNYVALFSETVVGSTTYSAQIVKLDSNYNYVSKAIISQLGHANDLAYNPIKNEIYIAPLADGGHIVVVDATTLAYKSTKVVVPVAHNVVNIAFDKKSQQFLIISAMTGSSDCYITVTDSEFNVQKSSYYPIPSATSWCQGMEYKDGLIYLCYSFLSPNGSNGFTRQGYTIRDTDGKLLETVYLPDILQSAEEIESIQIIDNRVSIATYTTNYAMVYEAEEGYSDSYLPHIKEATFYYNESNTKKNRDGSSSNPFNSIDEMFIKVQYVPKIHLEVQSNITRPITIEPSPSIKYLEIKGNSHECSTQLDIVRIPNVSVLGLPCKVSTNNAACLLFLLVQYAYVYQCSFTKTGSSTGTKGVKVQGGSAIVDNCSFSGLESGVSLQTSNCSITNCSGNASILAYVGSCSMVSGSGNSVTYTTKCYNEGGFENLQ